MDSESIPNAVAELARRHRGIIQRTTAVWGGVVGDLIRKAPDGPHEIVITPGVDTLFLTRSLEPRTVIKRTPGRQDRPLMNAGGLLNLVAAGDTLITLAPQGMPQMDRLAIAFMPEALQQLDEGLSGPRPGLLTAVGIQGAFERQVVEALLAELV